MDVKRRQYAGCETWEFDGKKWVPQNPQPRKQIRSYLDLDVFNLAYTLALWNTVPGILTSPHGIRGERDAIRRLRYSTGLALWNTNYSAGLALSSNYSTGLAMEVFRLTTRFPKEERYALVDQMRRSSRGVCGNIACPVKYACSCVALL